jgi:hypothetical protein
MNKRAVLLCFLLGVALVLCGCHAPAPDGSPPAAQGSADAALTYLFFSEGNSYFKRVQGYEFRAEEGKTTAYFHMANEEELYPVPVDQAWVDTLSGFISRYGMMDWDGFSGSAPGLLDGTHFSTEFSFAGGDVVHAGGYGRFPAGYGEASAAIDAHFMQLLPEDMRDW